MSPDVSVFSPVSHFGLDSCHLSLSHEEHIVIQGGTCLPSEPSGPCRPSPTGSQSIRAFLLPNAGRPGNRDCAFSSSVVLAQTKKWHKVGIRVTDFEVSEPWVPAPALPPVTVQPWTGSLFPRASLSPMLITKGREQA